MTRSSREDITIRREAPGDYRKTENMIREAFWDVYRPGCDEHLIVHKLRESAAYVPELDLVACDDERIVGAVICPRARIVNPEGREFEALGLIIGVRPDYQQRRIGSRLMAQVIHSARSLGFRAIILFGSPGYYPRFGFRNAREFEIQTADGRNVDAFMALPLNEGSLNGIHGRFHEDGAHQLEQAELEDFERNFPHKEKHVTSTQLEI